MTAAKGAPAATPGADQPARASVPLSDTPLSCTPLSRTQLLGYGMLGLPLAFAALPVYVYAPKFYAGLGVSLAASGAILLAARLADAFVDPLLGTWSDRVANRQRFIAWFLLPLAIGMVALFHPPASGGLGLTLWLGAALATVYLGFSAANIAYQAWGARLSGDADERTRITASREGLGLVGVVLASLVPQALAPANNPVVEAGLPQASILFVALLGACAAFTFLLAPSDRTPHKTPDKSVDNAAENGSRSHSPVGLRDTLASVRLRRLLLVFALNGIASGIPATLFLFFVADVLQAPARSGAFLALYFVAAACALPLWVQVSRRIGKRPAWLVAMALAVAVFAWAFLLGPGDVVAFAIICVASGIALGADLALPPSMLADVIERDQSVGGEGAYFGVWTLVTKLNLAIAAGVTLPALAWAGYQPGEAAVSAAGAMSTLPAAGALGAGGAVAGLGALAIAYCLVPCVLKLCAAGLLFRFDPLR